MQLEIGADLLRPFGREPLLVLADADIRRFRRLRFGCFFVERLARRRFLGDRFRRSLGLHGGDLRIVLLGLLRLGLGHDAIGILRIGRRVLGQVAFLHLGLLLGELRRGDRGIGVGPGRQILVGDLWRGHLESDLDAGRAKAFIISIRLEMRDRQRHAAKVQRERYHGGESPQPARRLAVEIRIEIGVEFGHRPLRVLRVHRSGRAPPQAARLRAQPASSWYSRPGATTPSRP